MTNNHTCLDTLRELGHRITPQRELIVEALMDGNRHMTAEQIYNELQKRTRSINLATVYRTLDLLVEHSLATRSITWDGKAMYASMQHGPHIHLICRKCGKIINADQKIVVALDDTIINNFHFYADLQHITILGLCQSCNEQQSQT